MISQDFFWFQEFLQISLCLKIFLNEEKYPPWKERSSLYCVQTSSFLFVGMWRVSKSSVKLNIQEFQSSRPKGDPGPLPVYQYLFTVVKSHPCYLFNYFLSGWGDIAVFSSLCFAQGLMQDAKDRLRASLHCWRPCQTSLKRVPFGEIFGCFGEILNVLEKMEAQLTEKFTHVQVAILQTKQDYS